MRETGSAILDLMAATPDGRNVDHVCVVIELRHDGPS